MKQGKGWYEGNRHTMELKLTKCSLQNYEMNELDLKKKMSLSVQRLILEEIKELCSGLCLIQVPIRYIKWKCENSVLETSGLNWLILNIFILK